MLNTQKKKVVFVLPYLYSGGAERALINLMNNLDRENFSPEIIVIKEGGSLKPIIAPDIQYHGLNCNKVLTSYPSLLLRARNLKPDIILTTMVHSNFLVMALKPFFPHTKFVIREAVVPSSILKKHSKKSFFIKLLYKALYPMAHKVISPSEDIVDEFKGIIGLNTDKNHVVINNQVDIETISKALGKTSYPVPIKTGTLKFVCAGRLHHQKGYDRLINALKNFTPEHDWHLVILGAGEKRASLEGLVSKNHLENNVHFLGHVDSPWSIISASDCLLLPSRWEGMPNIVLEALACGTRVITMPEANGVKEIKRKCKKGVVLRAKDMDDFLRLMAHIEPGDKVKAAPSLLPEAFSKKNITGHFERMLKDL